MCSQMGKATWIQLLLILGIVPWQFPGRDRAASRRASSHSLVPAVEGGRALWPRAAGDCALFASDQLEPDARARGTRSLRVSGRVRVTRTRAREPRRRRLGKSVHRLRKGTGLLRSGPSAFCRRRRGILVGKGLRAKENKSCCFKVSVCFMPWCVCL